jgi:predicted Zn-dependent peptidase
MSIETFVFPNGFRIIYEKSLNKIPICAMQAFCDVGSAYETDDIRGVSHFIEHMCFKGTKNLPTTKEILVNFDKIGADFNAYTEKNYTCYTLKCHNDNIENSMFILSDMLLNSIFKKSEFKKEEQVVIEENIRDSDEPEIIIDENADRLLYEGSSYGESIDTLDYHKKLFNYEAVLKFYKLFYIPSRIILSVVSSVSFQKIKRFVEKSYFLKYRANEYSNLSHSYHINPIITPQHEIKYSLQVKSNINTTHLYLCFRTMKVDKYKLNILKTILSSSFNSRLFMLLREENGLTYTSDVFTNYNGANGDFIIYAEMNNKKLIKNGAKKGVLPLLTDLIIDLVDKGITANELKVAKGYLKGSMTINMENNDEMAAHNGLYCLLHPGEEMISYTQLYDKFYKKYTVDDINLLIKSYFLKSNMCVCLVGENLPSLKNIKSQCEKIK